MLLINVFTVKGSAFEIFRCEYEFFYAIHFKQMSVNKKKTALKVIYSHVRACKGIK